MKRWDTLVAAVQSCHAQTLQPDEVIVVIDHNDELLEKAAATFATEHVIANESISGVSGARNTGVMRASGDILAFLDDDAYADRSWLENLSKPFADPNVVGCGGWLIPHWEGPEPRWFPKTFLWVVGCSYDGLPEDGAVIRNPIGANMALRRDVVGEVGGFSLSLGRSGTLPLGCEETELCIRYGVRHPDARVILVRGAVVHHRVPASRCTWKYYLHRCWSEGISKAAVADLVGTGAGLSSERRHALHALPRELLEATGELRRQPWTQSLRMISLIGGSIATVAGYIRGVASRNDDSQDVKADSKEDSGRPIESAPYPGWRPIPIIQFDLDDPVREILVSEDSNGRVWLEVIRGGQVLARDIVATSDGRVSPQELAPIVRRCASVPTTFVALPDELLPPITVVVPTIYRFPDDFARFVGELANMDYPDFEVIVVDNRTDPSGPMPHFPTLENVTIVEERIPGISAARNRGVRAARNEIVAFTDDDAFPDSRWLRAVGGRLTACPEISALGGMILPIHLETKPQLWFEEYFGGFSQSFEFRVANLKDNHDDFLFPYAPGHYASGCNMAIRKSVIDRVGGFCLTLGTGSPTCGGEDLEMFMRIALSGATVAFEPAALVRHSHRDSKEAFLRQVRGYGVGLTALYTSVLLHDPRHILRMAPKAFRGYRDLMTSRSRRSVSFETTYPEETRRTELWGMIHGPISYLESLVMYRRIRKQNTPVFPESARL